MDKFPNISCNNHESKPMACYCPECVETLCSECSYYHTLHLKHRPVPNVFIKFMPALLLMKINRCIKHNDNPEFQVSNHGNPCCRHYANQVHSYCRGVAISGSVRNIGLIGRQIFKVNAGDITGCAILSSGQIVFVDNKYDCLVLHEKDGSFNRNIDLLSKPYRVAYLKDNLIAVTLDTDIMIIDLDTDLTDKWVDLGWRCMGIHYTNDTLLVTMADGTGVCLVDLQGNMMKIISVPSCGVSDFFKTDDKLFFTACHNDNNIYCCDLDGNIQWTFESKGLQGPQQITADDNGYVYVVYETSMKVVVLSPGGKSCKILLCEQDGLHFPKAICLSNSTKQLLVCNATSCTGLLYDIVASSRVDIGPLSVFSQFILFFIFFTVILAVLLSQLSMINVLRW